MKFKVYGRTSVSIAIEVEAENREEAIEAAYDQRTDLDAYLGNGSNDKIVGVFEPNVSVFADSDIEYTEAEKIDA